MVALKISATFFIYHIPFLMVSVVPSMKDYEQLTRKIFYNTNTNTNTIKHFKTLVSMDTLRSSLEIPLSILNQLE